MNSIYIEYKRFIEARLTIVNKEGKEVPFILNKAQNLFVDNATGRDNDLKARQEGISAFVLAAFTADFLLKQNSVSVVIADTTDNAQGLLERVKWYIASYEQNKNTKVPMKYDSKYELHNAAMNSKYIVGTAQNIQVGRSKTITNAHLSEAAFYPHFKALLSSLLQAVVPNGKVVIETTANGFNDYKTWWEDSAMSKTGFNNIFFPASLMYDTNFLAQKRGELGRMFDQEYPETPEEAFVTSGGSYFDKLALVKFLEAAKFWEQRNVLPAVS